MKRWMIVTVETEIEWPTEETTLEFAGHTLVMRPPSGDAAADVRLEYDHPQSEHNALETICRFLSALSWSQHRPCRGRLRISCTAPMRGGKGIYGPPLRKDYRIPPAVAQQPDLKARIALALYREAGSVRGTPYEFLGYFKVINTRYSSGPDQIAWINRTIPLLVDKDAKRRVSDLSVSESDIGRYLYGSGRCAVAHAFNDPVVDPDDPEDIFRLSADMPVAKALAEYLIEQEYGIKWESSL
jgi:hypothetical protein